MFKTKDYNGAGHYIAHENDPQIARDEIRLQWPAGVESLGAGTVLKLVNADADPGYTAPGPVVTDGLQNVGDGTLTIGAVNAATAKPFSVRFTGEPGGANGTFAFKVYDTATGSLLGTGQTGTQATQNGVTFTATVGDTDPAAGDTFVVTIPRQDAKDFMFERGLYAPLLDADAGNLAKVVLYESVYADENQYGEVGRAVVTARQTTVKRVDLTWPVGWNRTKRAAGEASLDAQGIIVRATTIPVS